MKSYLALTGCLLMLACGDDGEAPTGAGGGGTTGPSTNASSSASTVASTSASSSTGSGGSVGCYDDIGPDNKERFVVVGHPNDTEMDPDGSYEVLRLSPAGVLTSTGMFFHMGPPADRRIHFTPDGEIGFAVQDDGTVGVFRLSTTGQPTVLSAGLSGAFYADNVRWNAEDSSGMYVMDRNFPENGGGVYTIGVGCDEGLTPGPRLFEAKSAVDMLFEPTTGHGLLAARGAFATTEVAHLHRVDLAPPASLVDSVDGFGHDDAITSWAALTRNGKHVILGDNSAFSLAPNQVAAIEVTATGLGAVQRLEGIDDPYSIAVSPFDDAVIVTSGFGDGIFILDYDPTAANPLSLRGELTYATTGPQLPGALTTVDRGPLDGLVLIADVRGVYMVQFGPGGTVTDLDIVDLGGEIADIVAGIGIQP